MAKSNAGLLLVKREEMLSGFYRLYDHVIGVREYDCMEDFTSELFGHLPRRG